MTAAQATFREAHPGTTPIRDLGLTIEGTPLAPILEAFGDELARVALPLEPRFYLSTEWGVPFGTAAIAIPFYLARTELTVLHAERTGFVEGSDQGDILRYLRHEMGHVVNYAYRLRSTRARSSASSPRAEELALAILGIDELSEDDKLTVARARKLQRSSPA